MFALIVLLSLQQIGHEIVMCSQTENTLLLFPLANLESLSILTTFICCALHNTILRCSYFDTINSFELIDHITMKVNIVTAGNDI